MRSVNLKSNGELRIKVVVAVKNVKPRFLELTRKETLILLLIVYCSPLGDAAHHKSETDPPGHRPRLGSKICYLRLHFYR